MIVVVVLLVVVVVICYMLYAYKFVIYCSSYVDFADVFNL
jgi:hypothetical protein